jgi:hypothetical protein
LVPLAVQFLFLFSVPSVSSVAESLGLISAHRQPFLTFVCPNTLACVHGGQWQ